MALRKNAIASIDTRREGKPKMIRKKSEKKATPLFLDRLRSSFVKLIKAYIPRFSEMRSKSREKVFPIVGKELW